MNSGRAFICSVSDISSYCITDNRLETFVELSAGGREMGARCIQELCVYTCVEV